MKQHVDRLLKHFIENGPSGVALSVRRNQHTLYENYLGYSDIEKKVQISADTIYRIYSMSKLVTCVAALQLYEQGRYLLNDPVSNYLPEFAEMKVYKSGQEENIQVEAAQNPILVKDLFKMTSGICYGGSGSEVEKLTSKVMATAHKLEKKEGSSNLREFVKQLAKLPLEFEPGSHWKYGLSHDVLGALIEVISGKSFGEYLYTNIFEPLGMKDTFFQIPKEKKHRLATLYDRLEDGTLVPNNALDRDSEPIAVFESGGAGLHSTLNDYQRFAHCLATGGTANGIHILSQNTIQLLAQNHLLDSQLPDLGWNYENGYGYGLGVRVMMDQVIGGSNSSLGEFGWSGLAGTYVFIDPKKKLSAVYMQQMLPNLEFYHQPRIRNVIYGAIH
ncbi:serine hydrolase domain-containing protein [Gracilibacillus dipsosauri]|uniref:serine hydrolase domain-containing protein n=1 Tax=Gracilibacillus dipsosauri TaxID=178340 RepID=UPI0024097F00